MQVQSNALAALEAIDARMAGEVMDAGCVTGDRINGLCDGISGDWYCKFDTYHPAVENGLPVTRVISRVTLQQILAKYAEKIGGDQVIQPSMKVNSFSEDSVQGHDRVWIPLYHYRLPVRRRLCACSYGPPSLAPCTPRPSDAQCMQNSELRRQ